MAKKTKRVLSLLLGLVLALGLLTPAWAAEAKKVTITVLETSDLHGMIAPFDYASNKAYNGGLVRAATVIKTEREKAPNLLLVDAGDYSQANYIQEFRNDEIPPMIKAMNYLKYDVSVLGNHEFNFEFKNLERSIKAGSAKVLAGNVYKADGTRWQDAYVIREIDGVKVAIFGITAPHVPQWEASDPTHYDNMSFTKPMEETGKILGELKGKADVILGVVHYGEDGEYETAGMYEIAAKYADQIDGLLIGHAHSKLSKILDCGVPIVEPGNNGGNVGKLTLTVVQKDGKWVVDDTATKAELLSTKDVAPDAALQKEMEYVNTKSLEMAAKVIGKVGETFLDPLEFLPGIPNAVIADNALLDLVNKVQMDITGADTSLAALFDATSNLTKGDFLHRDAVKVYKYDNTLYAVKVTGKQLKAIMEKQGGNFFNTYTPGDVTISFNPDIRLYNYDTFAGVNYDINISKPAGSRIENVTFKGAPLKDDQVLTLALNNYRYGGLKTAGLIDSSKEAVVYEGGAVRDMISDYVVKVGTLVPSCDNNWKITGAPLDDPQKDLIYEKVRAGELKLPTSEDGRTPNIAALNGPALRAAGTLPALPAEKPVEKPVEKPAEKPADPKPVQPETPPAGTYTVKAGDSLWKISQTLFGTGRKWNAIYECNKTTIKNPNSIYVGQVLTLPAA